MDILCQRTDGLGERLNALLNAQYLSNRVGLNLKVLWRNRTGDGALFHDVVETETFFSQPYIERHFILEASSTHYVDLPKGEATVDMLLQPPALNVRGWIVTKNSLRSYLHASLQQSEEFSDANAFAMIGFHPNVMQIIEDARAVTLPKNCVAMHLRAGDIIYGSFRTNGGATGKAISISVAKEVISSLHKAGTNIILFSQDEWAGAYLASRFDNIIRAEDLLTAELPSYLKAMFEITLMSRTSRVYSGSSGFAKIAARIGGINATNPIQRMDGARQAQIIMKDLKENENSYPSPQTAFAFWSAYYWGGDSLDRVSRIAMLDGYLRHDPGNSLCSKLLETLKKET